MEEEKDIDTLDNYLNNLYDNEEKLDDAHKFACIYGLIYIFKKMMELNLPLGIDFSFIFVNKDGLPITMSQTIKKINEQKEKIKNENNNNCKQFIIMSWNILKNEEINNNPFIKKNNTVRKIAGNYDDILKELNELILNNNLESLEKLIENKLIQAGDKERELLDSLIVNLDDEKEKIEEIEEENEEESEKDDSNSENEESNSSIENEENEENNNTYK